MKKLLSLVLVLTMIAAMCACAAAPTAPASPASPASPSSPASPAPASPAAKKPVIVHKFGHAQSAEHPYQAGALKYAELIDKMTDGAIRVEVFPSSQLGSIVEQVEGLTLNSQQYVNQSASALGNYNVRMKVFSIPYIFRSREHAFGVADSEIGQGLAKEMEESNLKIMGYWQNGYRHITNNLRPIKTPADTVGMKLRSQEAAIFVAFLESIGAVPSVIPFGELYTALEQGVVDGQENPFAQIATNKFYEVQKYLSETGHTFDVSIMLMGLPAYEALSPELQSSVEKASAEATQYQRDYAEENANVYLKDIKDHGMLVNEVDKEAFMSVAQTVYHIMEGEIGAEIIKQFVEFK